MVTFSTDETRLLDASELLGVEAFAPLADRQLFEDFSIDHGVLAWTAGASTHRVLSLTSLNAPTRPQNRLQC